MEGLQFAEGQPGSSELEGVSGKLGAAGRNLGPLLYPKKNLVEN